VVGTDFAQEHIDFMASRGIDLRGLQVAPGRTFRYGCRYAQDMDDRESLFTELNVFAGFQPTLPEDYRDSEYVFLANIDPDLQLSVLDQVRSPRLIALDTMNFWINNKRAALTEVLKRVDIVLINEAEARQYAETYNLIRAARHILALGPKALIIKKGEYGAVLFCNGGGLAESYFAAPAYPLENVVDPTGAGDTFAGAFVGWLARAGEPTPQAIRQAMIHGSVAASFSVEQFGLDRLRSLTLDDIRGRYESFKSFVTFEVACPWLGNCERLREASLQAGHRPLTAITKE